MTSSRPYLLLTNDDGIHAPGLRHLWEALHEFADIAIVAPASEKSGSGTSITWTQPLHLHPVHWELETKAWSLNGTPADCVKMALSVVLERKPDMVISGVNRGSNSGRTVLYSGTVGGVIEAAYKDIPGIAFSFSDFEVPPIATTKEYFFPLISHFLNHPLPRGSILNVNFPYNCKEIINGFKMTSQGKGRWIEAPERRTHPEGKPYYWLGGKWATHSEEDPNSDVTWLEKGFITAAPIHVGELTDHYAITHYKNAFEEKFNTLTIKKD